MAKKALKTQKTAASVDDFIDKQPDEGRRDDARALIALMRRITKQEPRMWGPSIIGFDTYHYRYESGHEGDMPRAAFSPRKTELVVYLLGVMDNAPDLMEQLGKHRRGKGCLYIKRLSDVDLGVLEQLIKAGIAYSKKTYG